MKRPFHSFYLVSGLLAMFIFGTPAVAGHDGFDNQAHDGFNNHDLKGEYVFTAIEVHQLINSPVEHCVIAGTVDFDGVGMVTINGTQRCSITGKGTLSGSQYYSVNPDGSFLISEASSMTDPVHGQIVDHSHTLLLDGTLRTLPEILSWSGVCMRR